ncbi:unnamed protein product [Cunninghamella blakesleeana]
MEIISYDTAISILQLLYDLTKEMNETYHSIDDDYESLKNLTGKVAEDLYNAKLTRGVKADDPKLKEMYETLKQAKLYLDFYHNIERKYMIKRRSHIQRAGHAVKKYFRYAPEFKKRFDTCTDTLNELQQTINDEKEKLRKTAKPVLFAHNKELEDISPKLRDFWYKYLGEEDWICLRHAVGVNNGGKVEVTGLMVVTRAIGFPIKKEKLPSTLDSDTALDCTSRIQIGKMIKGMIRLLSSEKMENHMYNVKRWYDKHKDLKKIDAAHKLYKSYNEIRDKNESYESLTSEEQLICDVEKARRDFSYFYQEFRVVVKFGSLPRSMLYSVNFPGERNINEYINYFKPLDDAYNSNMMDINNITETNDDGMDLYSFLTDFIRKENASQELEEAIKRKLVYQREAEIRKLEEEVKRKYAKLNEDEKDFARRVKLANFQKKIFGDRTDKNSKSEVKSKEVKKNEVNTEQAKKEQTEKEQVKKEQVKAEAKEEPLYTADEKIVIEIDPNDDSNNDLNDDPNDDSGVELETDSKNGKMLENHISLPPQILAH